MGNCLAGATCVFSHDPTKLMGKMTIDDQSSPPPIHANLQLQDLNSFPSLQPGTPESFGQQPAYSGMMTPPPGFRPFYPGDSPLSRSRPESRQQTKENIAPAPALDDNEAFPSLGSATVKQGKKHHGKRGGQSNKEPILPSSLADIVKMTPSPSPASPRMSVRRTGANGPKGEEHSAASLAIPSPKQIPWLETGDRANKSYLKARQEAIKHGGLRNKFLQRYL